MIEVARRVVAAAGYTAEIVPMPGMPGGSDWRIGDPTLMSKWYKPQVDFDEGIRRALKDYPGGPETRAWPNWSAHPGWCAHRYPHDAQGGCSVIHHRDCACLPEDQRQEVPFP